MSAIEIYYEYIMLLKKKTFHTQVSRQCLKEILHKFLSTESVFPKKFIKRPKTGLEKIGFANRKRFKCFNSKQ